MQKISLFIAMLALHPCFALASHWTMLFESPGLVAEFDPASVETIGPLTRATFRFTYDAVQTNRENGRNYFSAVVTSRFDCAGKQFAPYMREEFSGKRGQGNRVFLLILPESKAPLEPVTIGSANELMFQAACSAGTRPNNSFKPKPLRGSA